MSSPNKGYILPDPLTGYDLICLKMQIPDDQLYRAAIVGAITTLTQWWNWEKTGDNSGSIAAQYWRQLIFDTLTIDGCKPDIPPSGGGGSGAPAGGADFDTFLELLMELDMKFSLNGQLYEPAIPLVPCGCGDGSDTNVQNQGTGTIPGSTPGNVYGTDSTTVCDFLTTGIPWILDNIDDVIGAIQSGALVLDLIGGFTQEVAEIFYDDILDNLTLITQELQDPDFLEKMQDITAKFWNDPIVPPISRQTLLNYAVRFPPVFEGAPMKAVFIIWALSIPMQAFNQQLGLWAGTGDYGGVCAQTAERVGRTLYNPLENAPAFDSISKQLVNQGTLNNFTITMIKQPFAMAADDPAIELPVTFSEDRNVFGGGFQVYNNSLSINAIGLYSTIGQSFLITPASASGASDYNVWSSARALTTAQVNEIEAEVQAYLGWSLHDPMDTDVAGSRNLMAGDPPLLRHYNTGTGQAEIGGIFILHQLQV